MAKTPPPQKTYFLAGYIARIQCLQIYFDSAYIKSFIYKLSCFLPEVNIFFKICDISAPLYEVRRSTGEAGGVRSVPEVSILLIMSDRHHVRIPYHEYGVHRTYPGAQVGVNQS